MTTHEIARVALAQRKGTPVMRAPLPMAQSECPLLGERVNKGCGSILHKCNLHPERNETTTRHTKCATATRHCPTCKDRPTVNAQTLDEPARLLIESKRADFPHYSAARGDGVVYVGGGKYWPMIVAGIRMLRASGSTLPVEVWYRGGEETVYPSDVEGLNVVLCDSHAVADTLHVPRVPTGRDGGWSNKLFALYHTEFARVLFLDADAYCVENPAPLFAVLDNGAPPFAYWRDLMNQNNSVKWKNVYPPGDKTFVPPVQGGQLLIDRTRAASLISLAKYMCDNAGYYFKHMYGDQDTWRVALALGASNYKVIDHAHWRHGIAFFCGLNPRDTAIVHRCQGKLFAPQDIPAGKVKYTNPQYAVPREAELFRYFAEVVNKRPLPDTDIFNVVYARQLWGKGSGAGSQLREARPVVDVVNALIRSKGYTSLVDAGCGDGSVGAMYEARQYHGYDVSTDIIAQCRKKFPAKTYSVLDIGTEYAKLDSADILICKDVLHHQPNAWVTKFVGGLIGSKKYRALVFVFDCAQVSPDVDCHTGGYRALAPDMPPLSAFAWDSVTRVLHKAIAVKFL